VKYPEDGWDGARVRRLREQLGETQAQLAARLGTTQQTVSEWERGVRRPRRMAQRLLGLAEERARYGAEGEAPQEREP
jgi:DNA-binding transcriptional regulator YiaG